MHGAAAALHDRAPHRRCFSALMSLAVLYCMFLSICTSCWFSFAFKTGALAADLCSPVAQLTADLTPTSQQEANEETKCMALRLLGTIVRRTGLDLSTLNPQPPELQLLHIQTLNHKPLTLNLEPSTLSHEP